MRLCNLTNVVAISLNFVLELLYSKNYDILDFPNIWRIFVEIFIPAL